MIHGFILRFDGLDDSIRSYISSKIMACFFGRRTAIEFIAVV